MSSPVVIGIDIGKEVFHFAGLGTDGTIAFRRKIWRLSLKDVFEQLPPCVVGMEACLSAHFVSRTLRALGHEPRIIPAIYTKPFVKGQKNDYNDAEAAAEAALRPNLRVVQEKSQNQLDLQACHRVRSRLVSRRTATINQIRAFLTEQGIGVRAGARALRNSRAPSKHFMDCVAVIGPFTVENSETSRCYFAVPVSNKRGIPRHTAALPLFFLGENSENSGARSWSSDRDPGSGPNGRPGMTLRVS